MKWTDPLLRLRALLFHNQMDEALKEELQFHLDMQARKNQSNEIDPAERGDDGAVCPVKAMLVN